MKMFKKITFTLTFFIMLFATFSAVNSLYAQSERDDDPRTWKYFRIFARAQDDSVFLKLQDDLLIDPKLESYVITVNISDPEPLNQYIVLGDEASPDAQRFAWSQLSEDNQNSLIAWTGTNKENLNLKKLNYASVFTDVISKIRVKELIAPPQKYREIKNTTSYINPYLQIFGGDPVGIPLKGSFGFSFSQGTPYSGPLESEVVSARFHLLGASVGVNTRIKEFTRARESRDSVSETGSNSVSFANYNNMFYPKLRLDFSYIIPFGNFFEVGFYTTLDTGKYDPPIQVINEESLASGDTTYMPNLVVNGSYFNWEFRYPFRTFGSTRAKVYVARYLGETHVGYSGRELRLAGSTFDLRMDFLVAGERNFQILFETLISGIGEGFSFTGFAFGPSIRLGTTSSGSFGALTILANARFKVGDFFDEK